MSGDSHHTSNGRPYDAASDVSARGGEVLIHGPDGVAVALTPKAAAETSDRLLHAAAQASGQNLEAKRQADEQQLRNLR